MPNLLERIRTLGLRSCGRDLDSSDSALGALSETKDSNSIGDLKQEFADSGYLYFKGFLDPDSVQAARQAVLLALNEKGALDPQLPMEEGFAKPGVTMDFQSEDEQFPSVRQLVGCDHTKDFFDRFLGGKSRSLDHIWLRTKSPGRATAPHCDIVYMGRGTKNLFTIWIPLGDTPLEMGPLMILEGSNRSEVLKRKYCATDFDEKRRFFNWHFRHGGFFRGGQYTKNPVAAQRELGGRWLTTDFEAGDLVVFSTYTLHGSLDNRSKRVRLSADARFQLASEPAPRWVKH